jgi:hypothetical protein
MSKAELLANLQTENQEWEALLDQIGEARMEQPGVADDWSIKDIVAHLTGWRRRTVARLRAARRGAGEPVMDWPSELQTDDEINRWIYQRNRDRSLQEVLGDSRQIFQDMVAAVAAFSDDELADPQTFPWTEGEPLSAAMLFGHFHEEHEADMRAWLARQEAR